MGGIDAKSFIKLNIKYIASIKLSVYGLLKVDYVDIVFTNSFL